MPDLKPMPYGPLIELDQHISPEWDAQVLANIRYWADRDATEKHLTDAECAAETWAAHSSWVEAHMAIECAADADGWYQAHLPQRCREVDTWYRFATLPHAHEDAS